MSQEKLASIAAYAGLMTRPLDEVAADLEIYAQLLQKWQKVQNLVSRETLDQLWTRHFADSLQALKFVRASDAKFIDLGSGGGFPALPMAIALKGTNRAFHLVEPTGRKVSFLRTVARELDLPVTVHASRSDQIDSRETSGFDVVTSRALAALPVLCGYIAPFMGQDSRAILHKGREHVEEVAEARAKWQFDVLLLPSDTGDGGVLMELSNLRPAEHR